MNLHARPLPLCGLLLLLCAPAWAAPQTLILSPRDMRAEIHSRALVLNLTSTYQALAGQLRFDPRTKACRIDVQFVVRSLTAPNALIRAQTMSKTFLDPMDFPETRYVGACQGSQLTGSLTLRGQTHPFDMALTYSGPPGDPSSVHAVGTLNRYDWGLKGLHLALGKEIRITNDISLDGKPPGPIRPGA
jgi:polyisoprenoid-binding protein YceI